MSLFTAAYEAGRSRFTCIFHMICNWPADVSLRSHVEDGPKHGLWGHPAFLIHSTFKARSIYPSPSTLGHDHNHRKYSPSASNPRPSLYGGLGSRRRSNRNTSRSLSRWRIRIRTNTSPNSIFSFDAFKDRNQSGFWLGSKEKHRDFPACSSTNDQGCHASSCRAGCFSVSYSRRSKARWSTICRFESSPLRPVRLCTFLFYFGGSALFAFRLCIALATHRGFQTQLSSLAKQLAICCKTLILRIPHLGFLELQFQLMDGHGSWTIPISLRQ